MGPLKTKQHKRFAQWPSLQRVAEHCELSFWRARRPAADTARGGAISGIRHKFIGITSAVMGNTLMSDDRSETVQCVTGAPVADSTAKTQGDAPTRNPSGSPRRPPQTRGSDTEQVQFHYDISNEFFKLWQDPTQTYSCAYFERDDMSLEEAQMAKVDLSLGKLGLQPGMTLLDIGCGWGSTIMRAVDKYDVNVIGLTLSENQKQHIEDHWFANSTSKRNMEVRLQPWEDFDEPVDRIVSIGAFEHFGFNKYDDYFKKTFNCMPDDGVMLLHTIIIPERRGDQSQEVAANHVARALHQIHHGRDLPRRTSAPGRRWSRARAQGRLQRHPRAAPATALRHARWTPGRQTSNPRGTRPSRSLPNRSTSASTNT